MNNSNNNNHNEWQSCYLKSTDGRNRLPGFIKYLRERKKAAIAKFDATDALPTSSTMGNSSGKALLVVPFDPPPIPTESLPDGVDKSQVIYIKYLRDDGILKKKRKSNDDAMAMMQKQKMLQQQKLMQQQKQKQQQQQQSMQQKKIPPVSSPAISSGGGRKKGGGGGGSGLLGNLLGAQRRTENHLHLVRSNKVSSDPTAFDPNTGVAGVINTFRNKISTQLEQFKNDPTTFSTKISISLASIIKTVPAEEREKCTMDVFKFTIYEQVEEVGMDKWVAAKEPSDFMDECTVAIYKEGHCPPEVLENLNRGELPDEIKGQARHLVQEQSKAVQKRGMVKDDVVLKQQSGTRGDYNNDVTVLNTNKRDRRTLEQIQKDLQCESEDVKRSRFE